MARRDVLPAACLLVCLLFVDLTVAALPRARAVTAPSLFTPPRVVTSFRRSPVDDARAVTLMPDGRVLLAGAAGGDFGLAAIAENDVNDQRFGDDRRVTTDFAGADDAANAVVVAPDHTVVAAGSSGGNVAVARYQEADGRLVPSFGTEGRVVTDLGTATDAAYGVAAQDGGGVVVAGGNASAMVLLRYGSSGSLDGQFGAAGRISLPADGPARALAVQPDGRLVVTGGGPAGFRVARFLPDGQLDGSFGTGGTTLVDVGPGGVANALTVLADGRILVTGARNGDVALARLLPSGSLDPTFGTAGVAISDLGADERGYAVLARPDGSAFVVGERGATGGFVARFLPNGARDLSFRQGQGFLATQPLRAVAPGPDWGFHAVGRRGGDAFFDVYSDTGGSSAVGGTVDFADIVQAAHGAVRGSDGALLVAGETGGNIGLARYRPDGSLDAAFGVGGLALSDVASFPVAMVVEPAGRIVVAARRGYDVALVGFRPDGRLDPTFGTGGSTVTSFGDSGSYPYTLNGLADGKLLLGAGESGAGDDRAFFARYTADGHLDRSFGANGRTPGFPGFRPDRVTVQSDGKIVATAYALARFNADGTFDQSFGTGGLTPTYDAGFYEFRTPTAMALQRDGKILLGGIDNALLFHIVRYNVDGSRDGTWRFSRTTFPEPESHGIPELRELQVLRDGRVLAVGDFGAARYLPSGAADMTFGAGGRMLLGQQMTNTAMAFVPADGALLSVGTDSPHSGSNMVVTRNRISRAGLSTPQAWGWNPVGQLGTGSTIDSTRPVSVPGLSDVVSVAGGAFHSLALRADGTVWAWGWNGYGQLGDGTTVERHAPVQVPGLSGVKAIAAGGYHSLAVTDTGVWAWGFNGLGQLGDGTTVDRHLPTFVMSTDCRAVSAGAFHSLCLAGPGVLAWGWNAYGQLGDGTTTDRHTPVVVDLGPRMYAAGIAAGAAHSLATTEEGYVEAWGANGHGQLGDGTTVDRHAPVYARIGGGEAAAAVAAGAFHSVALLRSGTVQAWGFNQVGQVGDNTNVDRVLPTRVPGVTGTTAVAAGYYHSLAVGPDGGVWAWGWNGVAQLGDGTKSDRWAPVKLAWPSGVATVSAGAYHSFAR